jgi:hypothetical protein
MASPMPIALLLMSSLATAETIVDGDSTEVISLVKLLPLKAARISSGTANNGVLSIDAVPRTEKEQWTRNDDETRTCHL